jgi:hypothetical protein
MNDEQKRAFDFVLKLFTSYDDYNQQKEREAYVTAALYLGATVAVLTRDDLGRSRTLLLAGLGAATVVTASLVAWQLFNRHFAARMFGACTTVASREFHNNRPTSTLVMAILVPLLLLAWGIAVVGHLACS